MGELLLGALYVLVETLFEVFLELIGETIMALFVRVTAKVFESASGISPLLAASGYLIIGMLAGVVSLLLFPHPIVHQSKLHGVSVLVSPLITGFVMSRVGIEARRRGHKVAQIEAFGYGFMFAFGMAVMRFLCVTP